MNADWEQRSKQLFDGALELSGAERAEWLSEQCRAQPSLVARVHALLAAAEKDDAFLSDTRANPSPFELGEEPGSTIGPYRLVERIGEGGFGSVFLAEQQGPMQRRVALKVVKLGMDTRAVVARFEQERQALALMDHPNIARVFDAGATTLGRPYFVMELVRGDPITTYCDRAQLSVVERVELFTQVCRAVQHAHTKGVIHRDIKPSNVLVGSVDGKASAKVIDFGIAKATDHGRSDATLGTELHQLLGTPEYMSPEQASGSLDIDTRTDVYALGVLLYELLTGTTPFDAKELRSAPLGERQRILREVDPLPPSTRITRAKEMLERIAAARRCSPHRIGSIVRGELDWIVMRALEKDRARRYDSAGDLAADAERYLKGDPVEAAPPSAAYRFRKALRRNRLAVVTGALVAAALLVGAGVALWQSRVAARERDAARESAHAADLARAESEQRSQDIEQVAEFEAKRLQEIDPQAMGARMLEDLAVNARQGMVRAGLSTEEIEAREAELAKVLAHVNATSLALGTVDAAFFDGAVKAVDEEFGTQPAVQGRLFFTLGQILVKLGLHARAEEPLTRAVETYGRIGGVDALSAMNDLGVLRLEQARYADAETLFRDALNGFMKALGPNNRETIGAADNLGVTLMRQEKLSEAESLFRELVVRGRSVLGPEHPMTLLMINNIGGILLEQEQPTEAEPFFREAMETSARTLGEDDQGTVLSESNLALTLEKQGRLEEAEPLYRDAMERSRRTMGEEHPDTLLYKSNLGFLLCSLGRLAEAEPLTDEALATRRRLFGDEYADTLQSFHNKAALLVAKGDLVEAEAHFRRALAGRLAAKDRMMWAITQTRDALAGLLSNQNRYPEAEALLLDAERDTASFELATAHQKAARMQALISFYDTWERAEPGRGHAERAAVWKQSLESVAR